MFRRRKADGRSGSYPGLFQPSRVTSTPAADSRSAHVRSRAALTALRSSDADTRRAAAKELAGLPGPGVVYALGSLLNDPYRAPDGAAFEAIIALGELGGDDAVIALTTALGDRRFWEMTYLSDDQRYLMVEALARSLDRIGGVHAVLRGHLAGAHADDDYVRRLNLREINNVWYRDGIFRHKLGEIELRMQVEALRQIAAHDPDGSVRGEADHVLRWFATKFPHSSGW